eukprot:TRINITY_DN13114_c0_g1_i2.p1 TRINITY_DN13114_c0_g1~~TRINITY_DN13114_c0_g1_i2.p1  ORF type:complete len:114 (+),score=26.38 TRINITY_DN13114_c0_g1_i2:170-511(+)
MDDPTTKLKKRKKTQIEEEEKRKLRKTEIHASGHGKGLNTSTWVNATLQIQGGEKLSVRILCKETYGWVVQLKQTSSSQPSEYKSGTKFWARWEGDIDPECDHIPLVSPVHSC